MNEGRLIELAKKNNQQAMSLLLSQNYDYVYGYIIKICFNKELAEDICQETMVKAILNIKKFKSNSKISTWLIQIANNHYLNVVKRNKKIVFTNLDILDVFSQNVTSVEDQVITKTQFLDVMQVLNNYKENQRIPFILKHYHGYSYDEISIIMNCPIGTIRSRIHNTIKKLQNDLKGDFDEV